MKFRNKSFKEIEAELVRINAEVAGLLARAQKAGLSVKLTNCDPSETVIHQLSIAEGNRTALAAALAVKAAPPALAAKAAPAKGRPTDPHWYLNAPLGQL